MIRLAILVAALSAASPAWAQCPGHDGGRDFDFEIGRWDTELQRLRHPLSGQTEWERYTGTTTVSKVWSGNANLVELEVDGPRGHLEALSLRLYDPQARQWTLNFSNSQIGALVPPPATGAFCHRRGEFYDADTMNGRPILVRFVISDITPKSVHFEQSFSADGGRTWEANWIATDTKLPDK